MSLINDIAAELSNLDRSVAELKKFNRLMLVVFLILGIGGSLFSKTILSATGLLGTLLILAGIASQKFGQKIYFIWMGFAYSLGWMMSRVILFFIFFLVVTPIGMLARLSGKQFLDMQFRNQQESYWEKRNNPSVDYTKMS